MSDSSIVVAKFGGSSVADANQIRKIEKIIKADPNRRYVVVSAPGKRTSADKKITDLLYLCHSLNKQGLDLAPAYSLIEERYLEIGRDLGVDGVQKWLDYMGEQIKNGATKDWVASRGEFLSARLIARYMGAEFVDAADCIRFNADGRFSAQETYALTAERLAQVPPDKIAVIPGFYGRDANSMIRCFSRGGSDVTGAIIARAASARLYENWSDVSGMLMADPRIVEGAKPIKEITYREQRELSYMGATLLHDEAVFPVREGDIPIHFKNTNAPADPGTLVVTRRDGHDDAVAGIAGRKGFATIFTEKAMMNQERGYGRKVLEVLEANGISYEHSPTSIDTLSVIVTDEELSSKEDIVVGEIQRIVQPDRIEVQRDMAMIAVVGQGMVHRVGVAAQVFKALAESGVNIRLINQGSSELNIIVGVSTSDYEKAIRALYASFSGE